MAIYSLCQQLNGMLCIRRILAVVKILINRRCNLRVINIVKNIDQALDGMLFIRRILAVA